MKVLLRWWSLLSLCSGWVSCGILSSMLTPFPFQMMGSPFKPSIPGLAAFMALSSLKLNRDVDGGLSLKIRPGLYSGMVPASSSNHESLAWPESSSFHSMGGGFGSGFFGSGYGSGFGTSSSFGSGDGLHLGGGFESAGLFSSGMGTGYDLQGSSSHVVPFYGGGTGLSAFKPIHILHKPGGGTVVMDRPPIVPSGLKVVKSYTTYGSSSAPYGSYGLSPSSYTSYAPSYQSQYSSSLASAYGPPYDVRPKYKKTKKTKKTKTISPYYLSDYKNYSDVKKPSASKYKDNQYSASMQYREVADQGSFSEEFDDDHDDHRHQSESMGSLPQPSALSADHQTTSAAEDVPYPYEGMSSEGGEPLADGPVPVTVMIPKNPQPDGPSLTIRINRNQK